MFGFRITWTDVVIVAISYFWFNLLHQRKAMKLPPGPKGYPLVGNMFDIMVPEIWEAARKWGATYGDLIYLKSFGQSIVMINSYDTAAALLETRALNYSDRPNSVMLLELQRWDWQFPTKSYGDVWRRYRTPLQKFFEPANLAQYESTLEGEAGKLLRWLVRSPKEYETHIQTVVGSIIMLLTYGHEVTSSKDPFVKIARDSADELSLLLRQGAYLVDILPWLKHLPKWFPGTGFKAVAERGARLSHDAQYLPFYDARDKILSGAISFQSFTSQQMDDCRGMDGRLSEADEERISAISGVSYLSGADTSVAALMGFVLAMTLFPEVQKSAQAEIDQIIGGVRLPKLSDRTQLPYCVALCKEIQRWSPVTPMGVAHTSREDDIYNGYFIPANSIILPNQWAMLHDPEEYPDPSVFRPERFLPKEGERLQRDPAKIAFGFGRRICPGRFLAENTVFVMVARILAVFDILKTVDDKGERIEPQARFTRDGIIRHPLPFDCTFTPRSIEAAELIQLE